jgi:hypothetical protein
LHFTQDLDANRRAEKQDKHHIIKVNPLATLALETYCAILDALRIVRESSLVMPATHKKVIVRKMGRDSLSGYVAPANFVVEGRLELLNTAGKVVMIDLKEIKSVDFVRDFQDSAGTARKTFTTRPRTDGLWVRLKFTDNDVLEGMMTNDLLQMVPEGFLITPPDTRGNTQRIFVPKSALESMSILAVIGRPAARKKAEEDARQPGLFAEP